MDHFNYQEFSHTTVKVDLRSYFSSEKEFDPSTLLDSEEKEKNEA